MSAAGTSTVAIGATAAGFRTRQLGDAASFIRTSGVVVPVGCALPASYADVARHTPRATPLEGARGKVAVVAPRGPVVDAVCFQVSDCRTDARIVACSNATAAAAALAVAGTPAGSPHAFALAVATPGNRPLRVDVHAARRGASTRVDQTWRRVAVEVRNAVTVAGRSCAVVTSPLNAYLVIRTAPGESATAFPVADAVALWRRFGLDREPLVSRLAVVQCDPGSTARVKFFTCGDRAHPSAPLTGLAVLAIAMRRHGWPALASDARVVTPAGTMTLPHITDRADGTVDLRFPPVLVDLDQASAADRAAVAADTVGRARARVLRPAKDRVCA